MDKVNAVRFLPRFLETNITIILSGSVDKTIRIWQRSASSATDFSNENVLKGHTGAVNCLAVLSASKVFASGAADGTIKIWRFETSPDGNIVGNVVQSIETNPHFFPLALALHELSASNALILAVGGTKSTIQIFARGINEHEVDFTKRASLTGHEGWVRCLAFTNQDGNSRSDLLLASASQDKYIRLWRIRQADRVCAQAECSQDTLSSKSMSNKTHHFKIMEFIYTATFEALLIGHEDWIYTALWKFSRDKLKLLSASADNSLAIWEMDTDSMAWICTARIGEISAQKGATTATGSSGGFWIGLWSPSGDAVVSLGRNGSWRRWSYQIELDLWAESLGVSGHFKEVKGIAWTKDGGYLLSTSSDQTTRLHARWTSKPVSSWHEFARPQIHGFDLTCIDTLGPARFISGAEEKLVRVFDEPQTTAEILEKMCDVTLASRKTLPNAANIPVLGLSNKSIDVARRPEDTLLDEGGGFQLYGSTPIQQQTTIDVSHPPFEGELARHTLWPESEKLYGHGYEISALATSNEGDLVATACKASSPDYAVIRLFETQDWREFKPPLRAHSLTVTCLRFSQDDSYLLSVGRDRQWSVFRRNSCESGTYHLKAMNAEGHARMILGAAWAPDNVGKMFVTAGRDKLVKLWATRGETYECKKTIAASNAITAVDVRGWTEHNCMLLASGADDGRILVHLLNLITLDISHSKVFGNRLVVGK